MQMDTHDWTALCTALIAIGTWALVFATFRLVKEQHETTKAELRIKLQVHMEDRFDSHSMLLARQALASKLLAGVPREDIQETVMNFFESLGTLFRRDYLDSDMMWEDFSFHATRWWSATKDYILAERNLQRNDDTIFHDFQKLVDECFSIESTRRKLSRAQLEPSPQDVKQFLIDESNLL
jgi:hypothetical protein